ncbi:MAG TPA: hypothetical protein VIN62_04455 [Candidatus Cryosericum sp.]
MDENHRKPLTAESANFIDGLLRVLVRTVHLLSPLIVWCNVLIIPQTPPRQVVPKSLDTSGVTRGQRTSRQALDLKEYEV